MATGARLRTGDSTRKVFVIGLDCAAPELVFHRWRDELPNLRQLAEGGFWGELQSCTPAITVPAWSSMLSGKDPGQLGIYGFRNRSDRTYDGAFIATGNSVKEKRVWDYLTEAGKESIVIGVPQTYPIRPLKGHMVSDFLTPGTHRDFTHPSGLKQEVLALAPEYRFDVAGFRTENKDWLLEQIWAMTEDRFKVVDHLLASKPWDFFMLVEIGVDRIHHGFWSYHDPAHRRYVPGNPYENAIHDYYVRVDAKIGEWLSRLDQDTVVLVVSDHGAKRMDGGICMNEWLWREGYLVFEEDPQPGQPVPMEKLKVDWGSTKAWGSGGYYGRLFLNVQDREPQGVIPAAGYEAAREKLTQEIMAIPGFQGEDIGTRVFKPEEIYRQVNGIAPDLLVYFGDLYWRSIGTLGNDSVQTLENDTGPDDCNHAVNGMFILYDPANKGKGRQVQGAQLMDVGFTILKTFGIPLPTGYQGKSLIPG